jgi:hypothetical protein
MSRLAMRLLRMCGRDLGAPRHSRHPSPVMWSLGEHPAQLCSGPVAVALSASFSFLKGSSKLLLIVPGIVLG